MKGCRWYKRCDGINLWYTRWILHGEEVTSCASHKKEVLEVVDEDRIEKMIHDVEVKSFAQSSVYDSGQSDAKTPL